MANPWVDDIPNAISREILMDLPIEIEVTVVGVPLVLREENAAAILKLQQPGETYQQTYDRVLGMFHTLWRNIL